MPEESFFNIQLDFTGLDQNYKLAQFRWKAINNINGLRYGNGGMSSWTKEYALNMKTHETSKGDTATQVDFCLDSADNLYWAMYDCYSTTYPNYTPFQAWRAGFREGVKMSLDRGAKLTKVSVKEGVHWKNLHRLLIWCNIGADTENGIWAMMGAREGCYMTNLTDWDYRNVRDFDYLTEYWNTQGYGPATDLTYRNDWLEKQLRNYLGLDVVTLTSAQSQFFKHVYKPHRRVDIIEND